jgi:error-prone DNA polymerase
MAAGTAPRLVPWPRSNRTAAGYAELHAHSDHSLLDGVVSPEGLVARAAELGIDALALTDHDTLYGAVRFTLAAQELGVKPILGAEVTLVGDGADAARAGSPGPYHLTLLVENGKGYRNLCRLLTLARQGREKGVARLDKRYLAEHAEGLIALSGCRRGEVPQLLAARQFDRAMEAARGYARLFGPDRFLIELQRHHERGDVRLVADLLALADRAGLDAVATANAHYLHPRQREVHDVLSCTRCHTTLADADGFLHPNAEYVLRSPGEMAELFPGLALALETTRRVAARCAPATDYLPSGPQTLPRFPVIGGRAAAFYLRELCREALHRCYPRDPPRELLDRELDVIRQAGLADYFLIVWDIVRFARQNGIRCQGRGSAANSLVAYLLGISPIDPVACNLVFERFLSQERGAPPDIDVDFAADRREEVIQYVYARYGEAHAAMACTFVTYRSRSAVRDTARALGFPPGVVERLGEAWDVRDTEDVEQARALVARLGGDGVERPFQHLLRIAPQLEGIPRHLGIHNGGMVISGPPLCELVPLEPATMAGRVVTQWDKEGLEGAGMVKIDLLGLRMLSAIEDAVTIVEAHTGQCPNLGALTLDDPAVYDMLCQGQTVGVFQVESRAQAGLIPRFQPRSFADLVLQISLIRPGPIQANMVRPYLRRRQGLEPVTVAHPLLEEALAETLGVIVFQEQVLKVARDLAGFTPGRAELLRRALSHKRADEHVLGFREEFVQGALARGVARETAEGVFAQLRAFGGYAFPKSHAAAFAVLTYQSAWLRRYHPAAFFAGLLRNEPLGFYPPHVVVSEARRCGVEIRPVDVAASGLLATVEGQALSGALSTDTKCPLSKGAGRRPVVEGQAIRLGLAVVAGLGELGGRSVVEARRCGPFRSLADFCRRTRLGRRAVEALIWAGAFDGWGAPRRQLLWDLQAALDAAQGPPALALPPGERPRFGFLSPHGRLWTEVAHTGVSAGAHVTALVGEKLRAMGVTPSGKLPELRDGAKVWVGGVIVARQRPLTAKGTAFLALEDEGGLVDVVLKPEVYEAHRKALRSPFVVVEGKLQKRGQAISVLASRVVAVDC